MIRKIGCFIIIFLIPALSFSEIYRWTDSQGVTHFSDQPHDGAATVKLPPMQTYTPTPAEAKPKTPMVIPQTEKKINYTIAFTSPLDQATITPGERENMQVSITITPELHKGDQLKVFLDNEFYPNGSKQFSLPNLERGTHTLQAKIMRGNTVLAQTPIITFYVKQASQLFTPRSANVPTPHGVPATSLNQAASIPNLQVEPPAPILPPS
ncbi:MAG: DUF4124 domain-containing protein [Legionellales bacterium]|nr:DUF4124 domain-containing protein [Legionellales bacterium]